MQHQVIGVHRPHLTAMVLNHPLDFSDRRSQQDKQDEVLELSECGAGKMMAMMVFVISQQYLFARSGTNSVSL